VSRTDTQPERKACVWYQEEREHDCSTERQDQRRGGAKKTKGTKGGGGRTGGGGEVGRFDLARENEGTALTYASEGWGDARIRKMPKRTVIGGKKNAYFRSLDFRANPRSDDSQGRKGERSSEEGLKGEESTRVKSRKGDNQ